MKRRLLLASLALGSIACGRYFAPDRNAGELLAEIDVLGTWRLTAESLEELARGGFSGAPSHRYAIAFHAGGACDFASVLDVPPDAVYAETTCRWSLEHDATGCDSTAKKNVLLLSFPDGRRACLNFAREHGRLVLWDWYGDPDSWEFLEYVRAQVGGDPALR